MAHGVRRMLVSTNYNDEHPIRIHGMLVRSEEKGRGILKILVYAAVILTVVLSIWHFAETPLEVPALKTDPRIACIPLRRSFVWEANIVI